MSDGGFRGTSMEQDGRFGDKEKKLLKSMKFPSDFQKPVNMKKVNLEAMKPWIVQNVTTILGFEDEVVINLIFNLLEVPTPDPRLVQINLTGFLESKAPEFTASLWRLLLSAQESVGGIPPVFIEERKNQILKSQK